MSDEAAATPEIEKDLVGNVVAGKYRVDRLIGRGGMGAVFQATHLSIGKRVALKFLNRSAADDSDAAERFQREALAASVVESSHIVQIFDSGTTESGLPFLVMELLTGEDLRARLRREKRLDPETTASIGAQVLRALVRAHAAGIVHRDLKPDNVFLCQRDDGTLYVKIVDFGVSKLSRGGAADTLTRRGTVLGTVYYMSPEQAQAFPDVDGRTDLFSLGAILYECLAGRPPHQAPTYESVLVAICTKDPEDIRTLAPEISPGFAEVIRRALSRDREQRFESADAMLAALSKAFPEALTPRTDSSRAVAGPVLVSNAPGVEIVEPFASTSRAESTVRGHRARTVGVALVALLSGFALTALWVGQRRAAPRSVAPSAEQNLASMTPTLVTAPSAAPSTASDPSPPPSADTPLPTGSVPAPRTPIPRRSATPRASAERAPRRGVASNLELSNREP